MGETSVQEKRCEKTPVIALHYNRVRLQRADLMQNFRIVPITERNFEEERGRVEENQDENGRRTLEMVTSSLPRGFFFNRNGAESGSVVLTRFQMVKQSNLFAQLSARMQNLKGRSKFCCRFVVSSRGELRHFAQSNCREEEQSKPRCASDVSGRRTQQNPGNAGYGENNERGETPAMIRVAGAPCPR